MERRCAKIVGCNFRFMWTNILGSKFLISFILINVLTVFTVIKHGFARISVTKGVQINTSLSLVNPANCETAVSSSCSRSGGTAPTEPADCFRIALAVWPHTSRGGSTVKSFQLACNASTHTLIVHSSVLWSRTHLLREMGMLSDSCLQLLLYRPP